MNRVKIEYLVTFETKESEKKEEKEEDIFEKEKEILKVC